MTKNVTAAVTQVHYRCKLPYTKVAVDFVLHKVIEPLIDDAGLKNFRVPTVSN